MDKLQDTAAGTARRMQIEASLADYPDISEDRLAALVAWFRREASALDVATIASNERIRGGYRLFKAEHIERLDGRDMLRAALFLAVVGVALLGLVALAP